MSTIQSNIFNMEEDYSNSIKNKDFKNTSLEIISYKPQESTKKIFLKNVQDILGSCNNYKGVEFFEIYIDYNNFQEYHYEIMNNRFLVVIYDKENSLFKYITSSGKVFLTKDIKVINIINNVPIPYKISIDYVPLINSNNIKSLRLLTNILFNFDSNDPLELIKKYIKPNIEICDNEYYINYFLFTIYPKIEYEINKYNYWKYFHFEQEVFNISKKELNYNSINYDYLNLIKDNVFSELNNICKELNINIDLINNTAALFDEIYNNTNYYITINKKISNILEYDKLEMFIKSLNKFKLINFILEHKSLPNIKTHNLYGNINSAFNIDISFNISTKKLIRGSFKDLFFKILISLLHNKQYKNIANSDRSLIYELLKDTILDENELNIKSYLIENYIKAILLGLKSDNEILLYFENTLDTILSEEDYNYIKDTYFNCLTPLKELIDKYNNTFTDSKQKILTHTELDTLGIVILDKIRLIQKNLIVEIYNYCKDFNDRNKSKMDIFYFDDEFIYLIVDDEAINVAFDTLTRVMPTVFSKFCPSISSNCLIEIID